MEKSVTLNKGVICFAKITSENFDDSYESLVHRLRTEYIKSLQERSKALYSIATECFIELAGLAPVNSDIAKRRLDLAIKNTIAEQKG